MKKLLFVAMLLIATNVQIIAQNVAQLNNGKAVQVRLTSEIYSNKKVSTQPSAIVEKDVRDENGNILIKRGTPVQMTCNIDKARGMGNGASVKLNFISTSAVDGQDIALQGIYAIEGKDRKGLALGLGIGTGATILFPFGFFFMCIKGEPVTIPEQTIIPNIVINDNYKIRLNSQN
ncbi:MAG: hypothetical protein J6J77_06900 [Alistipes sp.]|nr:hypothetical protein [Alistipes sp.]